MDLSAFDLETLLLVGFGIIALIILVRSFMPDRSTRQIGMPPQVDRLSYRQTDNVSPLAASRGSKKVSSDQALAQTSPGRSKSRKRKKLIFTAVALFILFDVLIAVYLGQEFGLGSRDSAQRPSPAQSESSRSINKAPDRTSQQQPETSPPMPSESPLVIKPGLVNLSILGNFNQMGMKIAAISQPGSEQLSWDKPAAIQREPDYQSPPLYGHIDLGEAGQARFYFAFDRVQAENPVLYFDLNRNGNLLDDGPPLTNSGNGRFATLISIPFRLINPEMEGLGSYQLWFFTNHSLWKQQRASHYSRTQFTTELNIGGEWMTVWLAERGYNDADFTNDGLYINVNQDEKIDTRTEHFPLGESVLINGSKYIFLINNK